MAGHAAPARAVAFGADKLALASGGDDATVRLWDPAAGAATGRLDGHTDYVRALAAAPASPHAFLSGGYDHAVKLWDARAGTCVATLDHGAPVEAVLYLPGAGLCASAGGTVVKVWDALSRSPTPLAVLAAHQKTVTCLAAAASAGAGAAAGARLLTGSLDGRVRAFDLTTFAPAHAWRLGAPVTALALSPDGGRTLVVGCGDGTLAVRAAPKRAGGGAARSAPAASRLTGAALAPARRRPRLTASHFRYFLRGRDAAPAPGETVVGPDPKAARGRGRPAAVDAALRAFRHGDALDAALAGGRPAVVAALLDELSARGALRAALGGRDAPRLLPALAFARAHVSDPRYAGAVVAMAHGLLDAYAPVVGTDEGVDAALAALRARASAAARDDAALARVAGAAAALRALRV
jgi:U3 small nucleolar RNA-associated protein 15